MTFNYSQPNTTEIPLLISSPHSGRLVPEELSCSINAEVRNTIPDTDFDVDMLYDFAPDMGAHYLTAKYNRIVVDLNRDPNSKPLYSDGRIITGVVPLQTFSGEDIYSTIPTREEICSRVSQYFEPYHQKLEQILKDLKEKFGRAALFDCHSISRQVSTISPEPFPDLMLGTDDGKSLPEEITRKLQEFLSGRGYITVINQTFKGGFITRNFHNVPDSIFSVQLEMCKDLYLNESTNEIDPQKSKTLKQDLKDLLDLLLEEIANVTT